MRQVLLASACAAAIAAVSSVAAMAQQPVAANSSTITQDGSNEAATVTQLGSTNSATVTTADDGSLIVAATLPITVSAITQSVDHNTAAVDQKTQFNANQSILGVMQSASTNAATVT